MNTSGYASPPITVPVNLLVPIDKSLLSFKFHFSVCLNIFLFNFQPWLMVEPLWFTSNLLTLGKIHDPAQKSREDTLQWWKSPYQSVQQMKRLLRQAFAQPMTIANPWIDKHGLRKFHFSSIHQMYKFGHLMTLYRKFQIHIHLKTILFHDIHHLYKITWIRKIVQSNPFSIILIKYFDFQSPAATNG